MIFGRVKSLDAILATADYTYTYAVMGELLASSHLDCGVVEARERTARHRAADSGRGRTACGSLALAGARKRLNDKAALEAAIEGEAHVIRAR